MAKQSALAIDFAALRTLQLLYRHRSFTQTAAILGVNQSAVSYTVEKLRGAFDDPLFVRQGGKVVPTDRCDSILRGVDGLLDTFEQLAQPETFDPATAQHRFVIACNYYERQLIMPHIVRKLREVAPHILLETINSTSEGAQQLKRGEADMVIGPLRPDENGFFCRSLLKERYVAVMDKAHPLVNTALSLEDYIAAKHVLVTYGGGWKSQYRIDLAAQGLDLDIGLLVHSLAGLEHTLIGTDLIATVPSRIAASYGPKIHVAECPFPAPFEIDLVWITRTHSAPRFEWLRALISEQVKICIAPQYVPGQAVGVGGIR